MKIDEVIKHLNIAIDEIEKISVNVTQDNKHSTLSQDYEKICILARKNSFNGHVLSKKSEMIQELYIVALLSIISEVSNDDARNQYLLTIGRIISSFDSNVDFSKYITKCMKIDKDFWSDFSSLMKDDVANFFAVDAMLLCNSTTAPSKDVLTNMVGVLQLLGLQPDAIRMLASIAKSILKQNFQEMLKALGGQWNINPNYFLGYFVDNKFDYVSNDLMSCKAVSGNLLIANGSFKNIESVIDLDKFSATKISFVHCDFAWIRGIVSLKKKVAFNGCTFENNIFNVAERKGFLGFGADKKIEKDIIFFKGNNIEFVDSKFLNCSVSKHLLVLENSRIKNCVFKNCNGLELPCTYLFQLKNVTVKHCTFSNCRIETDEESRSFTFGGIVLIENGNLSNSIFKKCTAYGTTNYGK